MKNYKSMWDELKKMIIEQAKNNHIKLPEKDTLLLREKLVIDRTLDKVYTGIEYLENKY